MLLFLMLFPLLGLLFFVFLQLLFISFSSFPLLSRLILVWIISLCLFDLLWYRSLDVFFVANVIEIFGISVIVHWHLCVEWHFREILVLNLCASRTGEWPELLLSELLWLL